MTIILAICCIFLCNRIGGVMINVLVSSAIFCGFEPRSVQANDNAIGIGCLSGKHATLRRKSKEWLESG